MSVPRTPHPAQLVVSMLSSRWDEVWAGCRALLEERFGPLDYETGLIPFTHTSYYDQELGTPLFRRLLGFSRLVPQETLPDIKLWTNGLEQEYLLQGQRTINLDPGLLTLERLILATGKNFTHRVYLRDGIWADLTLIFQRGGWRTLPWTFSDYADHRLQRHLTAMRKRYDEKIKNSNETAQERPCPKA
ncbi:MAG: DUF4416 family protein [Desulfovibrionales bacterium]